MKKKKQNIKFILVALVIMSLVYLMPTHADSGWDSSYDSGGSSWSSGSSSWSSGSNSWSSSSNRFDFDNLETEDIIIIIGLLGMMLFFVIIVAKSKSGVSNLASSPKADFDIQKIKEVLPAFDENQFKEKAFETYKIIQEAWMDFDFETLRKYTTDELYNLYHTQLIALKAKKQKNIMKDFVLHQVNITDMEANDKTLSLKVFMTVECFDYVVDKTEKVVRGTKNQKLVYQYEMTFIKGLNQKDNKCPNCNAPLENVNSSKCPYCDSTIIGTNYDFVLSKKQMLKQRFK